MIKKLKKYIADIFGTEANYAKHKGCTKQHINGITKGAKFPPADILQDIGLVKVVVIDKKVSFIPGPITQAR